MPTKKFYKKKTNYKKPKKPKLPARYQYADMAYKGFKMAMKLKQLINTEMKHADIQQTTTTDWTGTLTILNSPAQGDGDTNRDGDSILNKNIKIRGAIARNGLDAIVRIIVFKDKQNDIATTAAYLLNTGSAYAALSQKQRDNRFLTKKLYDEMFIITASDSLKLFSINIKDLDDHTNFTGGTTTIVGGSYKILLISNIAPATGSEPQIQITSRFEFLDN